MGFLLAFLSAFFQTSKDLVSKNLSFNVSSSVSAFASFFYALPFYLVLLTVLYLSGVEDFTFSGAFFTLVILRSLTDCGAEFLKMHAFNYGDISLVSSFLSLGTVFLLITSPLITGDEITSNGALGVILIVIGSFAIGFKPKNTNGKSQIKGILFATLAALFFSINACLDRLAVQIASPTLSGFTMTLLSALMLLPFILKTEQRRKETMSNRKAFLVRGAFEVVFMVLKLWSLQYLQAPYVSGILKSSIIFSIIGGKVVFKEHDFIKRLIFGIIIVVGLAMIIFMK